MISILLKKQLMELFSFFYQDKKKNENRTGVRLLLFILIYIGIFVLLGVVFYNVAEMLCKPLVNAGLKWLYFALMGLVSIALGVFGSVFNTFASLYQAKDNELLLSMPIKPSVILFVRMAGVYAMGLLYELIVMVPVLLKYFMVAGLSGAAVAGSVLVTFLLSVFILTLSCILGWGVALISSKTKQKSMIVVVLSLAFLAGYYYVYGMAYQVIQDILANPQVVSKSIQTSAFPLYHMGLAAVGKPDSLFLLTLMVIALFAVVYLILAKGYMKIVTTRKGQAKIKYKAKEMKVTSVNGALLRKELKRFLGSPNYMLNCGLGIVLMPIAAVALLVKEDVVLRTLQQLSMDEGLVALVVCVGICTMTTMNDITAPSVSLEGNNIWLLQVFPVTGWQVLCAKLKLHLLLTLAPAMLLTLCVEIMIKPSVVFAILIPVIVVLFALMMAVLGLVFNLKMPNLNWTNEIVPIKQSMSSMLALFGGWAVVVCFAGMYFIVRKYVSPLMYAVLAAVVMMAAVIVCLRWLKTRGADVFENL